MCYCTSATNNIHIYSVINIKNYIHSSGKSCYQTKDDGSQATHNSKSSLFMFNNKKTKSTHPLK